MNAVIHVLETKIINTNEGEKLHIYINELYTLTNWERNINSQKERKNMVLLNDAPSMYGLKMTRINGQRC
mgnify:CR=1 FL=1